MSKGTFWVYVRSCRTDTRWLLYKEPPTVVLIVYWNLGCQGISANRNVIPACDSDSDLAIGCGVVVYMYRCILTS